MSETNQTAATGKPVKLNFSHLGIIVHNLARMEDFYTRVLGFTVSDRGVARGAKIVFTTWDENDHHQMVLVEGRPEHMPFNHINQMSFRVGSVEELQAVHARVKDAEGVHDLYGTNHGNAWSIYFRDPEGNRVEIFCDSPWYIDQPCVETLDLSLSADEIRARSLEFCKNSHGFKPAEDYRKDLAAKIKAHSNSL
ncbi:MAG: VOC family protein [Hyphomicrobiales bacterium]|nr:VOC family protein [Hyphomicrobiales bacterium]